MIKRILFSIFYYLLLVKSVLAGTEDTGGGVVGFIWEGTGSGGQACNIVGPCDFCDSLIVTKNVINFLFQIAFPITVEMIVYGAIRMMISAGSEEQVRNAKHIMTSAVIGLVIALSAWIIVGALLHILAGNPKFAVWNEITCLGR